MTIYKNISLEYSNLTFGIIDRKIPEKKEGNYRGKQH